MKPPTEAPPTPPRPRALKRQADNALFANNGSGFLLYFEDPAILTFVRNAAETVLQPANDLERLLIEQAIRNFWRTVRHGNLETAAIDAEMADHQEAVESRWGKIDPESLYHLSTREPATRAALREHSLLETAAFRRFKEALLIIKSIQKGG